MKIDCVLRELFILSFASCQTLDEGSKRTEPTNKSTKKKNDLKFIFAPFKFCFI